MLETNSHDKIKKKTQVWQDSCCNTWPSQGCPGSINFHNYVNKKSTFLWVFLNLFFNKMIALYHFKKPQKNKEKAGKMSVPARNQLCGKLKLCTGTGQVWDKTLPLGCPAKPRKGSRADQWAWHILHDILWVQAARAGKPWSGLCDHWGSCDNQVRWQTSGYL